MGPRPSRRSLCAFAIIALALPGAGGSALAADAETLADGWKRSYPVGDAASGGGGVYQLIVQDGWLHVSRKTADDRLEWYIMLAEVAADEVPQVTREAGSSYFAVSYRDGRYFIREDGAHLLCIRQEKDPPSEAQPIARLVGRSFTRRGRCTSGTESTTLAGWEIDEAFFVTCGPSSTRADVFVRLNSTAAITRSGRGAALEGMESSPIAHGFAGDATLVDDGRFLHVSRAVEARPGQTPAADGAEPPLPPLPSRGWINVNEPVSWADLGGRVVLVDFWASWCPACETAAPQTQRLYARYRDQGLTVVGVHVARGTDQAASFARAHGVTYPIVTDNDNRMGAACNITGVPTYYLLDRQGRIASGPTHSLPTADEIESLLGPSDRPRAATEPDSTPEGAHRPEAAP